MATSAPNLSEVLLESRQIIKSQPRNFFALSFLFLVPSTIATLLYPKLQSVFIPYSNNQLLVVLAYTLLNLVFFLCTIISITYTAFHAFSGEEVELKSAIRSISSSFFPLLGTTLLLEIIIFVIAFILSFFLFSGISGALLLLGFRVEPFSSPYFHGSTSFILLVIVLAFVVVYLRVNWALAQVVVVVESAWGFKALKRSRALVKGKRGLVLCLCLIFMLATVVLLWSNTYYSSTSLEAAYLAGGAAADDERKNYCLSWLILALRVLITSGFLTLIQLYNMTATTVLYAYCKDDDDHEYPKGFSGEYVSLPVDDYAKVAVV